MPARIAHIGFVNKSSTLYEALKRLTGLEQLASIATGAAALGHRNKRFLKYAKDNGADRYERDFAHNLERARELAEDTSIDLSKDYALGTETLVAELTEIEEKASSKAGEALALLTSEVADSVDLSKNEGRDRLNKAVRTARHYLSEGTSGAATSR